MLHITRLLLLQLLVGAHCIHLRKSAPAPSTIPEEFYELVKSTGGAKLENRLRNLVKARSKLEESERIRKLKNSRSIRNLPDPDHLIAEATKGYREAAEAGVQLERPLIPGKVTLEFFVSSRCPSAKVCTDELLPMITNLSASGGIDLHYSFFADRGTGENDTDTMYCPGVVENHCPSLPPEARKGSSHTSNGSNTPPGEIRRTELYTAGQCMGDKVQLCAYQAAMEEGNMSKFTDFILCQNRNQSAIPVNAEACALEVGYLDGVEAIYCPDADELLLRSAERTFFLENYNVTSCCTVWVDNEEWCKHDSRLGHWTGTCTNGTGHGPNGADFNTSTAAGRVEFLKTKICKDIIPIPAGCPEGTGLGGGLYR